ncbi:hypothetical protein BRADI_2g11100v3 [Brachypodium distachyon]|uniref:BHLH domain-containing protein n=1 Tax=Brachypodium distachyon TaxID=15368 RepID=A0A2K2D7W8_BRADI|nr:hypothetical protein BRADI_2g11100v3 [Brachypodium distachyon]
MSDGNEFAELLWENGQAVVHGRRKHPQPSFQPFGTGSSGVQEKHPGGAGDNMMAFTKAAGVFGGMGIHDLASGLQHENGDDDAVPWIHYPIMEDDNNNNAPALTTADYSSDFFSELQEAAANLGSLPPSNHSTNNNRGTPVAGSSRAASKEIQGLSALTTRTAEPQAELAAAKQPRPSDSVMNFSLFSRPAALARATLQSAHRPQGTDKVPNAAANNRMESTVIQTTSGPRTGPVFVDQRAAWPQQKEVRFAPAPALTASVGNLQQEMARDKLSNNRVVHKDAARKAPDATVTTSSVCSGNGIVNDEPWHQQKRKIQAECSASQDEDLDDESGALLRSTNRSMKRSRTAEVHNLSERRRRDRINEKMRALQELIPNCNKIDKASMLDEAIEYLKTLQLQVQMMSMGTGLCIPPMLLPPAMQHLQLSQMAHFPHLGMGLGCSRTRSWDPWRKCHANVWNPWASNPFVRFQYTTIYIFGRSSC